MTLRALLVDDERLARAELRRLLLAHPEVEIVAEADGINAARAVLATQPIDVVFLDVQMPGGTGFDLLLGDGIAAAVVFVTAYDAFALRAFEVNAIDYLLKPVHPARLAATIERLTRARAEGVTEGASAAPPSTGSQSPLEGVAGLAASGAGSTRPLRIDDWVFAADGRRARFVKVARIAALLGADDYAELITDDGTRQLVAGALRDWETRLPSPPFVRVHRSALVSLEHVTRVLVPVAGSYELEVRGVTSPVPVSRRQAALLRDRLG